MFNPYLAQQLKEERVKDALREAEQARLIRTAKSAGVADQAALHRLLIKIRGLGLPLVSINHIEPAMEESLGQ